MNPSDSLKLDEHLARLLAAYDQEIGTADGKAVTVDVTRGEEFAGFLPPGERPVGPLSGDALHLGSANDLLPDSLPSDLPQPVPTPAPTATHRVGRFELRRQLGKGGCGIVFLAYDPKLQREVALKIPRPEMLLNPDARRRLMREARAAAEFDHPNLVPVYETGEIGPVCFIATAFCPGQTLAEWIDHESFPVPVRQAARLVAQIADAVQHAHDRGVLHRDLKPNNIILQAAKVDPNDQGPPPGSCPLRGEHFIPRVVDFGLAKISERGPAETATRQILGTPKYMAPEQAQARHDEVDARADVYALGVILYELVVGRAPYEGASDVEVLRQAVEGNLTPPGKLRKDIPRDLEAICLKAMALLPARRYRTAIDLADDLRRFLDGLPTLARPLNVLGRAGRWFRRNDQRVALAVVSLVATFFLAVGGWNTYQFRVLQGHRDADLLRLAARSKSDMQWEYGRQVGFAFLAWRAGDAQQMSDSLFYARNLATSIGEEPDFAWRYLSQLGRVELASVPCPPGPVVALAASPDGSRLATGHADGTLAIWDRAHRRLLGSVKAHPAEVNQVMFLAGGSRVLTAGNEPVVRVWDVADDGTVRPAASLPELPAAATALAASPDGAFAFVGSGQGECVVYDLKGNRVVRRWAAADRQPVAALAVSPDGTILATVGKGEPLKWWDAATGAKAGDDLRGAAGAVCLAFAPGSTAGWTLAAGREDGTVRLFDRQGREVRTMPGHYGPVLALAVGPDGTSVASGGRDDCVCVWDATTGALRTLLRGHEQPVRGVLYGKDGRTLFTAAEDGRLKLWDLTADPEGLAARGLPAAVAAIAVRPDGQGFATAYSDGSVEVYTPRSNVPQRFAAEGRGPLGVLRWPATGMPLGVELRGRSAVCWEFGDTAREAFRWDASGSVATAADLAPNATRLAVGDDRGRVTVWSLPERAPVISFDTGLAAPVRHLCLSDDGKWLATQTEGHAMGIWEVGDPTVRYRLPGHRDGLWLVRFLPGGDRLVTSGRGSSIKVWNVVSGHEDHTMLGHVGRVTGLTASPDGRTLVSGSSTGEVKLWDLRGGQELVGLRRHTGPVTAAEFAAAGHRLVTGGTTAGGRGELAFWDAKEEPPRP